MLITSIFNTPAGWLNVEFDEHYIYRSLFINPSTSAAEPLQNTSAQVQLIAAELKNYFNNRYHRFQLPLKPAGTTYQQRVWHALLAIPAGYPTTYGELARHLQSGPRAIGQACKNNPLALFIPCHRVVAKNNQGGYMGKKECLIYKNYLLNHEAENKL